jgi:hypothetical protein
MASPSHAKLVEDVLKDVSGVFGVRVSSGSSKVTVRLRDGAKDPDLDLLNRQLEAQGYRLYPEGRGLLPFTGSFFIGIRQAIDKLFSRQRK